MLYSLSDVAAEGETGVFWKSLPVILSVIIFKFPCKDY